MDQDITPDAQVCLAPLGTVLVFTTKAHESKRDTTQIRPPSPPLTRARAATATVLYSGNSNVYSFINSLTSSTSVIFSIASHCSSAFVFAPLSLNCPLNQPPPRHIFLYPSLLPRAQHDGYSLGNI